MKKKGFPIIIAIFTAALLVLVGTIAYTIVQKKEEATSDPFNYKKEQTLGEKNAPVHVVEFGDFKCPACRTWDTTVLPQLQKEYIEGGKVQFHFINFPFIGNDSERGARAGEAIYKQKPEAFWTFYDAIYAAQQNEDKEWITEAFLLDLVKTKLPMIDIAQFQKDMSSTEIKEEVQKDKDRALKLKVQGAPTIYVNGKLVNSNFESIKKEIQKQSKK